MNIKEFKYNEEVIPIKIVTNKKYKNISIRINKKYIRISKPLFVTRRAAIEFLNENKEKIILIYKELISKENNISNIKNGDIILLFGQKKYLTINFCNDNICSLDVKEDKIYFYVSKLYTEEERKKLFKEELNNFLKKETKKILERRLVYWAKILNETYNKVSIKCQKTIWGSAEVKRRNLNFNMKIAMLPEDISDYIIVHELCHFKEPNHSKMFWNEVKKYIPNYKQCKKYLKDNITYFN